MDHAVFRSWLDRYFDAWESNDPAVVGSLFAPDAVYGQGPFREAWRGRDEIVRRWTSGARWDVEHRSEVLAVEGEVGVASWQARTRLSGDPVWNEYDGVLTVTLDAEGRCLEHREWFGRRELKNA
jgi:ketosteroid isomerase-like protein